MSLALKKHFKEAVSGLPGCIQSSPKKKAGKPILAVSAEAQAPSGLNFLQEIIPSIEINGHAECDSKSIFGDQDLFTVRLKEIGRDSAAEVKGGDVTAFQVIRSASPIDVCHEVCHFKRGDRLRGVYYERTFQEYEMYFSALQVESILMNPEKWHPFLNLDERVNIFPVKSGGKIRWLSARLFNYRWTVRDSVIGFGRGYDAGAKILFRNPFPKESPEFVKKKPI